MHVKDKCKYLTRYDDAMLIDKTYQGAMEVMKAIYPYKRTPERRLLKEKDAVNSPVAHDRVEQENYFVRMCTFGLQ